MGTKDGQKLGYSRQALRRATKFVEGDYSGINPRQFYRSLKRSLEEIQEGGDFKYSTHGTQENDLEIKSEQVGDKTGRVKGRLMATSEAREVGRGQLEYKPYGPHGAATIVIGGLLFLMGLSGNGALAVLGLLSLIGGGYLYFKTDTGEFPVEREDIIRALMTGEVSERMIDAGEETRSDIFANMSVIYAGDALLNVSTSGIEEMDWTLRRAVVKQVNRWYNEVVDEDDRITIEDGFVSELSSWSNRSLESDRRTVVKRQNELHNDLEKRIDYTEIVMDQLPNHIQDELDRHQNSILNELEALSDDMEIYVEREGLQKV